MDIDIDDMKPGTPRPSLSTMYSILRLYKDDDYLSQIDALSRYAKHDYDIDGAKVTHCVDTNTDILLFNKSSDITPVTADEMYIDHAVDCARLDGAATDSVKPILIQHVSDTIPSTPCSVLRVGDAKPAVALLPGYLTYTRQQIENFRNRTAEFSYVGVDAMGVQLKPRMYNHKVIVGPNSLVHMKPPREGNTDINFIKYTQLEKKCKPINYRVKLEKHGYIRYDPNKHDVVIMVNDGSTYVLALYKPNNKFHAYQMKTSIGTVLYYTTTMHVKEFIKQVAIRGYYFASRFAYHISLQFCEHMDSVEPNYVTSFPKYDFSDEVPVTLTMARTVYEHPLLTTRTSPHHLERIMEHYRRYREHVTRTAVQNLYNSLTAMDETFLTGIQSQMIIYSKDYLSVLYDRCLAHPNAEIRARAVFLMKARLPRKELILKLHGLLPALTDKEMHKAEPARYQLTKTYTRR